MKRSCMRFLGVVCILCGLSLVSNASALTYQDGSDIQFTFNSTLSISLSDADIVIGNLIPGQDDTSNAVDIVVNTNNLYGYTLTATVGSATKDYRDLRHTNGTANFASIDVDSDLSTLSGQSSSVWGYTTSTNGNTWSNYNGLPKYDDVANTAELNVTDGAAADSTTSFKIGAYAAEGQLAGDYTNVINFKVVSNILKLYIQDVTFNNCPTERTLVYDRRDEKEYYIQKITTGYITRCWMTTNNLDLAAGTPLYSDTSNVPEGYPTSGGVPYYTLPAVSSKEGFTNGAEAYIYNSSNTDCPSSDLCFSYYSFAAATAGTNPSSGEALYDICPRGWRLPSSAEYSVLVSANTGASIEDSPWYGVYSGYVYNGGSGSWNSGGTYWTSSVKDASNIYTFYMSKSSGIGVNDHARAIGYSVRCVAK